MANPSSAKKRLLVVEDEEYLRDLYVEILRREGFTVEEAGDGETGLKMMQKGGYDLILLDVMLPKMDGFQILEKLNDTPPEMPNNGVLILTNLGKDINIAKGLALGARGYLMKTDITPDQVVQEVKSYLK